MGQTRNWRSFSRSFGFLFLSLINLLCPCCKFIYATDTLLPGQVLNQDQSLVSKSGAFKLGYDCSFLRDYKFSDCALGIWYVHASLCHDYFPVWQTDLFLEISTPFNISLSGNGVLNVTGYGYSYWSSPAMKTTSNSAVAVLLDNGNLVIRDQINTSMVIWQSFDNPSSVLLSGGSLGFSKVTSKNITLTTYGNNALTFNEAHTYMHLNRSGILSFSKFGECDSVLWSAPESVCDFDSYCGPYSLCTISGSCKCPVGFDPPESESWIRTGCSRNVLLYCQGNSTEEEEIFYTISGIHRYPEDAWRPQVMSMRECQSACLRDCTCTAFSYNTTCLLWFGKLRNTIVLDSASNDNHLYIRLATKQSSSRAAPFSVPKKGIAISVIGALTLIVTGTIVFWKCRRRLLKARSMDEHGTLTIFSFAQIKNCTKNFSDKLGEGGFGCVFKGTVPVSTTVAVKVLKGSGQGDKQFRTEVQTIGMIQHTNLVRLLGFCSDEGRRLLVYEYMVNGSLNSHLFSNGSITLSWELRYHVALGTARGLAYLHEQCIDCIIHCDIKPDNILLDEQFCPKIADFGMAKLLGRDFSRVLTTMRGTIGYLAPEWISGLPITHKADVYSYGMMLLEIISGRRNSEKIKEGKFTYFPIYAAVKAIEGNVMCLLDDSLEGNADAEQLKRFCKVACWCIQDAEDHRPMMGQVVRMLEGVLAVEIPTIPRSLQKYVGMDDSYSTNLDSF